MFGCLIEVALPVHNTLSIEVQLAVNNKQQNEKKVIAVKSAKMDSVTALYKDLKTEWDKSAPNLRKCGSLLDQLKVNID